MNTEITMSEIHLHQLGEDKLLTTHLRDIFKILKKSKGLEQMGTMKQILEDYKHPPKYGPNAHDRTKNFFQGVLLSSGGFDLERMSKGEYNSKYIDALATTAGRILHYDFLLYYKLINETQDDDTPHL